MAPPSGVQRAGSSPSSGPPSAHPTGCRNLNAPGGERAAPRRRPDGAPRWRRPGTCGAAGPASRTGSVLTRVPQGGCAMRKLLLSLSAAALLASGCAGAATMAPTTGNGGPAVVPDHHLPTPYPQPQPVGPGATPYGGVTYQDPGTNPWVDPARDEHSTFALDVDTASYSIAKRYVADGNQPDPASIRVEEWVNAFAQGYPAPEEDAFTILADGGPTPFTAEDEVL